MTLHRMPEAPSPFVARWVHHVAADLNRRRDALDVAMGRGRHLAALRDAGFTVFGVDVQFEAVRAAAGQAAAGEVIRAWCADLTNYPLPKDRFDLVVVTRYLQRDLFPSLQRAIAPGGFVLYETFTTAQRTLGRGPTSPDHLLNAGELLTYFEGWEIRFYEETVEAEALARVVARKPTRPPISGT